MVTRDDRSVGILVLPPDDWNQSWKVLEVDVETFDRVHLVPGEADVPDAATSYESVSAALAAGYEILTLMTEGRVPAMHEHVQESVREFIELLEDRGYDRRSALQLLTQMVDRMSDRSPVQPRPTAPHPSRRAS